MILKIMQIQEKEYSINDNVIEINMLNNTRDTYVKTEK